MANIFDRLYNEAKKKKEEFVAQINMNDGGRTANTVRMQRAGIRPPQPLDKPNIAQRVVNQLNPLDNGRTFKQATPTNTRSGFGQATHNGATNLVGGVVKPLVRTSMAINQGIGNAEVAVANAFTKKDRPILNGRQFANQSIGRNLNKAIDYTGTKRQIAGDAISNVANVAMPGSSKLVTQGVTKVAPKFVPKLIPKMAGGAAAGAASGAVGNVGSLVASNEKLTPKTITQTAATGAKYGAVVGGAIPVAPIAARGAVKGAKAVDTRVRVANDRAGTLQAINSQQRQLAREAEAFRKQQQSLPVDNYRAAEVLQRKIDRHEGQIQQLEQARPKLNVTDRILTAQPGMSMKRVHSSDLTPDQNDFIEQYAEMLKSMGQGNGVDILPDGRRVSNNYRAPGMDSNRKTNADWFDRARKEIESGKAAYGASDEYKALPKLQKDASAADALKKSNSTSSSNTPAPAQPKTLNKQPLNRPPEAEPVRMKMDNAFKEINDQAAKGGTVDAKKWREANKLADEYWKTRDALDAKSGTSPSTTPAQKQTAIPSEVQAETPKTVKLFIKSKFRDGGGYADVPVIRKVDNKTLYQGGSADGRQFWTENKKYAEQFGPVTEKTGSFYQVDNGNRMTTVYVDAKSPTASPKATPAPQPPDAAAPARPPAVPEKPVGSPLPNDTPVYKQSKFANDTVQRSDELSPTLKKSVGDEKTTYQTTTNKERLAKAEADLTNPNDEGIYRQVIDSLDDNAPNDRGQNEVTAIALAKKLDENTDDDSLFKSTAILTRLSEKLSKNGQEMQAAALLASRTPQGLRYKATKDLQNALGDKFTIDIQRELQRRVEAVKKAKPGSDADAIARDNLQYFVAQHMPTTTADKVVNFWRAGLLTAPTTTGGAAVGNAAMTGIRKLWINPGAAITDALLSVKTGQRSYTLAKGGEWRKGAKRGAQNATSGQFWKTGYDPMNPMANADTMGTNSRSINYGNGRLGKATGAYVNGVYKLMGAADQPFRYGAHDEILSSLAKADAKNQGLSGKDATQHINDFINNPPDWAQERAVNEAMDATFQNQTKMASVIQGAKRHQKQLGHHKTAALLDFLVPFSGVPSSVADRAIRYSGLKAGIDVTKALLNARKGEKLTLNQQRDLAKVISEGTVGLPIVAAGFALAQAGKFTGAYPTDQKERDLWKSQRKQENSVKIGDRWYSMNYIQPFGVLMSLGAGIAQTKGEGGKTAAIEDYVTNGAASAVKSFSGQSYLQGLQGPIGALNDPEREFSKYTASVASSVVPNAIRSLASAGDRTQRETKGVVAGLKGAIPGVRQSLPAKQDMFGQDIPAKDTPANMYLNPLKPSKERTDPTVTELGRLKVMPTKPAKDAIKGATLSAAQVHELSALTGPAMKKEYDRVIASADYKAMSDDDKKKALQKIDDTVYGSLKQQYAMDKGLLAKADLNGNQKQYLNSGKIDITGTTLPKGMNGNDIKTLKRFEGLNANEKEAIFTKEPDAEYKLKLANFERDKKNGNFTSAELETKKSEVFRAKVGSEFPKEVRDVYAMSKSKMTAYLANHKDGNKLANAVVAYGDKLAQNGIEDNKVADSKGNISIVPKGTKIEAKSDRASKTAQKYGVPDNIFAALIKQESGGNQGARSEAGAIGLTQLLPSTAKELGVDPNDPDQNLDGGARYLKAQYNKFKSWPLALAAYNAGPGAVEKYGGIPPFEETQNYVKNIMAMVNGGIKGNDLNLVLNDPTSRGGGFNRSGVNTSSSTGTSKGGRKWTGTGLSPSDFKTPFDDVIQSSTKGAQLARNAKLVKRRA